MCWEGRRALDSFLFDVWISVYKDAVAMIRRARPKNANVSVQTICLENHAQKHSFSELSP